MTGITRMLATCFTADKIKIYELVKKHVRFSEIPAMEHLDV